MRGRKHHPFVESKSKRTQKAWTINIVQAFKFWICRPDLKQLAALETYRQSNESSAREIGARFSDSLMWKSRWQSLRLNRHARSSVALNHDQCCYRLRFARVRPGGQINYRAKGPISSDRPVACIPGRIEQVPGLPGASIEPGRPASRRSDVQHHQ
jgi:hypothetical protein